MKGQLDLDLFRLVSSSALQALLEKIVGAKTLVLAANLAGPLGLVTEVGVLRSNNAVTKMFWLEPGPLGQAERNIVYLCRPEVKWMSIIADQIKAQPKDHQYHLLVVPRLTTPCKTFLSDAGVLGAIEIQEFQMGLIPLDRDILSLELDHVYKKLALDGDYSPVYDLAKGLMTIQRAYGVIPHIIGKGDNAQKLTRLLHKLKKELPLTSSSYTPLEWGPVDSMIVLDRSVDMITPLCTQLTYEGLLDEIMSIKNSHIEIDPALLNPAPVASSSNGASTTAPAPIATKKKKHLLSSMDTLYADLRDKNFAVVGSILNRNARRLNEEYEKRHLAKTPQELRQFVGQLTGLQAEHQSLKLHTSLTEQIMAATNTEEFNRALEVQQNLIAGLDYPGQENAIRGLINQEIPLQSITRLLCLYSIISGGLKPKVFDEFKREFLQTYGYQYLPLLMTLTKLGLFTRYKTSKTPFSQARKSLQLIVDDVDEHEPQDIAYTFSGYAPLSVRLVMCAIGETVLNSKKGSGWGELNKWKGVEDVVGLFEGAMFVEEQSLDENPYARSVGPNTIPTTIVCYLGGITFAEVSALRFLNSRMTDRNLVIVTTGIIQGNSLLSSLMPESLA